MRAAGWNGRTMPGEMPSMGGVQAVGEGKTVGHRAAPRAQEALGWQPKNPSYRH